MQDDSRPSNIPVLMLESEVAERLRCSPQTVRRLRKAGKLAYIPGRPVKIEEGAVNAYLDEIRIKAAAALAENDPAKKKHDKDLERIRLFWLKRKLRGKGGIGS